MKISFAAPELPKSGALVVLVHDERVLSTSAMKIDEATGGQLRRAIDSAPKFKGKREDLLTVFGPTGLAADRVVLAGCGKPEDLSDNAMEKLGAAVAFHLDRIGVEEASVMLADVAGVTSDLAARFATGARLRMWRFDRYRTKQKADSKPSLGKLSILVADAAKARKAYAPLSAVADGVEFARDLVSEPPNQLYPESYAERAKTLTSVGLEVEILDEKKLKKLGMGALLAVGQGSARESRVVVMRWNGGREGEAPIAFVGKGVTFDTGGISLKPGAGMEEMKWDMAGSAAVTGAMMALAGRKAKVNAVGVIGLVENMPDGAAQRPGDVVTSMSGQTIEVLNTDAEGRLVLADCVWYTQDRFHPKAMVDLATLTGAMLIALGTEMAGIFTTDDGLAKALLDAGQKSDELVWRMPLAEAYDKEIDSDIADVKNIAGSRNAGSIIGAQFIKRFTNDVPWAHIDIAGMAWSKKDKGVVPKGATAYGVRLLDRLVADHYEG